MCTSARIPRRAVHLMVLALACAACATATASTPRQSPSRGASAASSADYEHLALEGITGQAAAWHTSTDDWYCETLGCGGSYPLLTVWGIVRMFESVDAVALASPTAAHRAAVESLAARVETLYWNKYLVGFDPYPGDDYPAAHAWFDDNGWLGLAFVDAFRATGDHRWLDDGQKALDFIAAHGWDGVRGMWWNTTHTQHSGEAVAADTLLAMMLDTLQHGNAADLADARRWIDWADAHDIGFHGLYDSLDQGNTVIDYVEAPMIYAQYLLCQATGTHSYCTHAAAQSQDLQEIYGFRYNLAPLYDSIFFQWMMAYESATGGSHWLDDAETNAAAAIKNAPNARGLWLNGWWGTPIHDPQTLPNMFRTMAGTTSLYAWLAYYTRAGAAGV